jgi:hypothetical protein
MITGPGKRDYIIRMITIQSNPVYNGHPWDPEIRAVVDRWSLFRGSAFYKN